MLDALTLRMTEYTIGDRGPSAMPALLPPTSMYTYAVELTADEAMAAGATTATFSEPLIHYVDNFLGWPIGWAVPVGDYDWERGAWVPAESGRTIGVASITGGLADLVVDGSGTVASPGALAALGITDEERAEIALRYAAGSSLWRVRVPHFSTRDYNGAPFPPSDARRPDVSARRTTSPRCLRRGYEA